MLEPAVFQTSLLLVWAVTDRKARHGAAERIRSPIDTSCLC